MVSKVRRSWLGWAGVGLSALLGGCLMTRRETGRSTSGPAPNPNDPDAALKYKFRGIYGGELRVSASFATSTSVLYTPDGHFFNIGRGVFGPGGDAVSSYGGSIAGDRLVVPKYLRYMRYHKNAEHIHRTNVSEGSFPAFKGEPLVDVNIPVASRIPDEVLDRIRQYKGSSLALRLRITPETLLVGWEIKLGRDYPFKKDKAGNAYATDEDIMVGGDFLHARPRYVLQSNGNTEMVHQKGWQLDPKTGRKFETDF
ncbi:MAG: hypothetical protein ACOZE7_18850 [Pseudomonadota bacterium]